MVKTDSLVGLRAMRDQTGTFKKPRLLALDLLRGIAALMVAIGHTASVFPEYYGPAFSMCVAFFFLLSGYVLSHAYGEEMRSGRMSFISFILARMARLYPLHLLTGIVMISLLLALGVANSGNISPLILFENITLTQSLFSNDFSLNPPSWSIGAEFWCGLLFCALYSRKRWIRNTGMIVAISAFALCEIRGGFLAQYRERFGICLGLFLLGWILFESRIKLSPRIGWATAIVVFGISLFPPLKLEHQPLSDLLYYALFSIVITGLSNATLQGWTARIAEFSGDVSYGIYLWHWPFLVLMEPKTPPEIAIFMAAVIATSAISFRVFERPARSLLRRSFIIERAPSTIKVEPA